MSDDNGNFPEAQDNPTQKQVVNQVQGVGQSQSEVPLTPMTGAGTPAGGTRDSDIGLNPLPDDIDMSDIEGSGINTDDIAAVTSGRDEGPKTGAGSDHPYNEPDFQAPAVQPPIGKDLSTPPDNNTDVDSEADIGDPSSR